MTSKEAMQDLRKDARNHLDYHTKYLNERLDVIEKDLEVLNIVKKKRIAVVDLGYKVGFMNDYSALSDREVKLLEEWLEDESNND